MEQLASNEQQCLNCQQPLQGEYCHHCGQHHRVYVRSIFAVLGDLMGELGHWDSRFYRTLRGLFLRPGFLSQEFMAGKHVAYVPPLRLYFFISLIAFVIFSATIDIEVVANNSDTASVEQPSSAVEVMPPKEMRMDLPFLPEAEQTRINERLRYLTKNPDLFVKRLVQLAPQMMLILLPFWAFFLKLIYVFRRHYYLEHLTVALHTHSFILLTLMLVVINAQLTSALATLTQLSLFSTLGDWIDFALGLWIFVYLFLTQKNFYQQGWLATSVKFVVSGLIYIMLLLFAFVGMVIYSVASA